MKSKKVTMLAAALVVAVVAFAAVGYATTQYTAKTTSTNDKAESAYVKVSQDGTGSYEGDWLTKVYFNTVNGDTVATKGNYTYQLQKEWVILDDGSVVKTGETAKTMALISSDLKLSIAGTNSTDGTLNLTVTTDNLTPVVGLKYRMLLVDSVTTQTVQGETQITAIGKVVDNGNAESSTASGKTTWQFDGLVTDDSKGNIDHLFALLFIEEVGEETAVADPGERAGFATSASFDFLVTADDA